MSLFHSGLYIPHCWFVSREGNEVGFMAKKASKSSRVKALPPEMREHLQQVLDVPEDEFEAFLEVARAEIGAMSKQRLASFCKSVVTEKAHAEALASVLGNDDLDAEKMAEFVANLRGWNALAGKEGGAFSEGDLEKLVARLEALVPDGDFPSVALY
ncbi:MAG: hypothetical protein JJU11_05505, partial [Candidatus Sumerlaeia bacterium]|nr:hypothetical protein [Candidatus Sumerlaeia bacterium]